MPHINMSLQVIPQVAEERIYEVVDQAIRVIQASGVPYIVGPMETTMEGEMDQLWDIAKKAQEACVEAGASRVVSVMKIDYKPGGVTMKEKVGKYL